MSETVTQSANQFSWAAHPAAERMGHAAMAGVVMVAIAGAVTVSFESMAWGIAAILVLVVALNRFFFPSHFVIDDEGITAQYPLRRRHARWDHLRRFLHDENGGFLSTRAQPSRLDAYQGMHILFGSQKQVVIERIRAYMASNEVQA